MNRRMLPIAGFILAGLIVIMIVAIVFMNTLIKDSSLRAPTELLETEEVEPVVGYAIPGKPVPSLREIDDSIKRSADERETIKKAMDEMEKQKKVKVPSEMDEEQEIAEVPNASAAGEKKGQTISILTEKKEVLFPTMEEVKKMRSRGIIAY